MNQQDDDIFKEIDDFIGEEYSCETEEQEIDREQVLSLQDVSQIGADEYMILIDYAIANIYNVLNTTIKTKMPQNHEVKEMASDVVSLAVSSFDSKIAKEKDSTIRTYIGWKVRQVVKDYARAVAKSTKNILNNSDDDKKNYLSDISLVAEHDGSSAVGNDFDMQTGHATERSEIEQLKKLEWAMRQVRFELPKENNVILDVVIGEIKKSDDTTFTLTEWSQYTNQRYEDVKRLFAASKKLIKMKLFRKGYMDILKDEEKTTEDLLKDTNIKQELEARAEDENIIDSIDIKEIVEEADELTSTIGDIEELLKD